MGLLHDLAFMLSQESFAGERLKDGELLEDSSSSVGVLTSSGTMGSFPLLREIRRVARPLSHTFFQDRYFFQSGPAAGHSHAANIQHDFATPLPVLLAPLAFSPCLDVNGGIDLLTISSSECLTLRLPRTNQMWKGESTEV